jgi:glycosyltransferase involved in cell wall biosynthesis
MQIKVSNKILFFFGGFASVGGIETFTKNLLTHLQGKNFTCTLLCWDYNSQLLPILQREKIKIIRSPWRSGCRWNIPHWILSIIGIQEVKQADLILFGKLFPVELLKMLRFISHKNTKFIFITPYNPSSLVTKSLKKQGLRDKLNFFDMILVQSAAFHTELRTLGYQGRVEVIPYIPHQSGELKPFPPTEELKIGFLGRLVEDKNIPLLLQAFERFQKRFLSQFSSKKVSLHLFGSGELRQEMEQYADKLGIKSAVVFHGNISNSQIDEAIASCHLFAFTSTKEGQCLAALEILACGRPIVATEAGAFPEILADKRLGRLIESANPENFADGILDVVNLINQQAILPQTIRSAYLERYEPTKLGDRYIEILNSCSVS